MSKLDYIGRPWVAFDASDRQHRQWFAAFQSLGPGDVVQFDLSFPTKMVTS